jgi:hypothetical protein
MEFKIPKEFIKPYVKDVMKLAQEGLKKGLSEQEVWTNVLYYFNENELEYIVNKEYDVDSCYEFALKNLKINYPRSIRRNSFEFTDFVNSNKIFEEINSKKERGLNQIVVYYSNPSEYLHTGLINSINNEKIRLISQWGDEIQITHPLERIDITYGDKYKIFKIKD